MNRIGPASHNRKHQVPDNPFAQAVTTSGDDDTLAQMGEIVEGMGRKRPRYRDLTKPNGLDSGARR